MSSEQATHSNVNLSDRLIRAYPMFVSLFFLISVPIAVVYTQEWDFFENLMRILTSPSKLITDYFALGGLGSTLFNAAICGFILQGVIESPILGGDGNTEYLAYFRKERHRE